jgi:hypothetical protein
MADVKILIVEGASIDAPPASAIKVREVAALFAIAR